MAYHGAERVPIFDVCVRLKQVKPDIIDATEKVSPDKPPIHNDNPAREDARLVYDRIFPGGVVPPKLSFRKLKSQFLKEWYRDPELAEKKPPSDSSLRREAGRKN
jgi:hypothetical protein